MANIDDIVNNANSVRDTIYKLDLVPTSPVKLKGHKDPLDFLSYLEELKQYLPFNIYFEKHFLGSDPFSNAALVRHVDFESKGRGGLDFKLERIYSSLTAYSVKGEFLTNKYMKRFYEELKSIVISPEFKNSVMDWLCEKYRSLLIAARDLENEYHNHVLGYPPHYEEEALFPDVDSLINSVGDPNLPRRFADDDPLDFNLEIDYDKQLRRYFDRGYDTRPTYTLQYGMPPMFALSLHLQLMRDDFISFIETSTSRFDSTIAQLEEQETVYIDSILGDGWTFNLPHIQVPTQVTDKDGFIFFDGYIKEEYDGEEDKIFPKQQGSIIKLSLYTYDNIREILQRFLNIYEDNRITQEDIDELEYRFKNAEQRIYYFDTDGKIRFITDETHNNIIKIDYIGSLISEITDAARNTYQFFYRGDGTNKLEKIVSSYGKEIEYVVKKTEGFDDTFLLESVTEGNQNTAYLYEEKLIFHTPLFVNGTVHVPIIYKETNPLGGVVFFHYHAPEFEETSAGFSRTSIVEPDSSFKFRYAKTSWNLERIRRNYLFVDILVSHPRIEEGIKEDFSWKPKYRKTVSVYKDHIVEHEFEEHYDEMKLVKRISQAFEWNISVSGDISKYTNYLGDIFKEERFVYSRSHDQLWIKTTRVNPSPFVPLPFLKEEYVYPENWQIHWIYGLPEEIIFTQEFGAEELGRIKYSYHGNNPLITEIKGDTKHIHYQYFDPPAQDPAGCGKPTIVTEITLNAPFYIRTYHWYDEYGNLIKTKNAENRFTRYEYKENNGQPVTFLHKIIEEERNV